MYCYNDGQDYDSQYVGNADDIDVSNDGQDYHDHHVGNTDGVDESNNETSSKNEDGTNTSNDYFGDVDKNADGSDVDSNDEGGDNGCNYYNTEYMYDTSNNNGDKYNLDHVCTSDSDLEGSVDDVESCGNEDGLIKKEGCSKTTSTPTIHNTPNDMR
jgi:hypothetical protein